MRNAATVAKNHRPGILNGFENRKQPQSYNSNPLHWLKRQLKKSPHFDDESRSHALLWLKQIAAQVGDDPKQLGMVQTAVTAYAQCVRLTAQAIRMPADSDEALKVANLLIKWQDRLGKSLRMSGIRGPGVKGNSHTKAASVFTASRSRAPSELDDESV